MSCPESAFAAGAEGSQSLMYTDEPVAEKDVAPGQIFCLLGLLNKITGIGLFRVPHRS
jgi:hypothetical protein